MSALLGAFQAAWLTSLWPDLRRFQRALRNPARTQRQLLLERLAANASCAYGQDHGFAHIASVADFQRRVPVVRYDALTPYVDRIAAGEPGVLTAEPVTLFERSGGSTGQATKLIPYTAALLRDFQRATHPWLVDLHRRFPRLLGRPSYWSLSPVAQGPRRTAGGVPIGIDDDTRYFGPLRRFVIERSLAVPGAVARARDFASWRLQTLRHLVACQRLGFISIWSPTFLVALLEALAADPAAVLTTLDRRRARAVAAALEACDATRIWPDLQVISCWADGPSALYLPALERWFPGVPIAPKGLLATEGVVSIPFGGAATLALTSTFLELIDLERPAAPPLLADELRLGAHYSPLITTGGGLYRYHLGDIVECVGPLQLRFVGKRDQVTDLTGEKLHAQQVGQALAGLGSWDMAFVAPVAGASPPYYCAYVCGPGDDDGLAARLDARLCDGHAYRYSRDLGQLAPLRVQRVPELRRRYLAALIERGQRLGDIKPSPLEGRLFWPELFGAGEP